MIIIVKNVTNSDKFVEDLGIGIKALEEVELSELFTFYQISCSKDIIFFVQNNELVINDGSRDLTFDEALKFLSPK